MDVSAVSSASTDGATSAAQDQMGVAVLRKSLDTEQAVAQELIQAAVIPGLGEHLDVRA